MRQWTSWVLENRRAGPALLKRPGLSECQAVLLPGGNEDHEIVLTADSREELRLWNGAITAAIKCSPERVAELEELVAHHQTERDEMLIQLEVAKSELRHAQRAAAASEARDDGRCAAASGGETEEGVDVSALRAALHREVDARSDAELLREAAAKRALELDDMQDDLDIRLRLLREQAMQAAGEARRLRGISRARAKSFTAGKGAAGEERVTWQDVASAEELAVRAEEMAERSEAEAEAAEAEATQDGATTSSVAIALEQSVASLKGLGILLRGAFLAALPEASLLYGDVLSVRAKLRDAQEQWVDHLADPGMDPGGLLGGAPLLGTEDDDGEDAPR